MKHLDKKIIELEKMKKNVEQRDIHEQQAAQAEATGQDSAQDNQQADYAEQEALWQQEVREGIHNGRVEINGSQVEFEKIGFFQPILHLLFPKDFLICTFDTEQQKVFQNEAHAVNVILQYTDHPGQEINMEAMKPEMIRNMKSMELHTEWVDDGVKEVNGQRIHYCSFLNPVAHGKVFNFLFFVDVGRKRLIGNINCNGKYGKLWTCIAQEMIDSVEVANG
ncbi:hypothetical protein LQV63_30455 [Paenibacillus profundus]|uniref:Uncharacterized protein n=1 Tax=Paenibacillus profundus TaxID=1173085 RepID=A0ABS8YRF4_9BACL|nr:hypothetical protein [Paenibacillus profundus]MCE5173554.1 hypothetical protein [Paenibacillus profundus]